MCGPSIQGMVRCWVLGRNFGIVLLILWSSQFHPTRNIMNAWHLLLSVSASPHCSHQYRTIPFVTPYFSGLKSDLFLVYWMIGLWWQVFFLPVSSWEYGEKSLLFFSWLHFKSKLSLENAFWFSYLFTETYLLNFTAWNFRNSNPRELITYFLEVTTKMAEGTKGTPAFDNCPRILEVFTHPMNGGSSVQ